MSIQFLSREATDKLARNIAKNLDAYRTGKTEPLIHPGDCRVSRIDAVAPPDLLDGNGEPRSDAEATQQIFQWLSHLTPVQASDERLWTLLTHSIFSRYVHERWGSGLVGSTRPEDRVIDRWFFRGTGVATFVRNGISRLWWFGYLTHDSQRANPFELTEVLLSLQDIQVAFLERSLGRCRPLLHAVLVTVKKHATALHQTPNSGDVIQEWAKQIRLYGGAFVLDAVPPERLTLRVDQMLRARLKPQAPRAA